MSFLPILVASLPIVTKALPCPFCGGESDFFEKEGITGTQYYIACTPENEIYGCCKQYISYDRLSDAIKAWNHRTLIIHQAETEQG